MNAAEEVYTPSEIDRLHQTYGWSNYIASSAHSRRMQSEYEQFNDFLSRNFEARDTWATVSFEDWQRHLKHDGNQAYWGDFVARRDKALEGKK